MLDIDLPRSADTIAASAQLDLVLVQCRRITCADCRRRRFHARIAAPAFAALGWLARERFDSAPRILAGIDALRRATELLVERGAHLSTVIEGTALAACPVCGADLGDVLTPANTLRSPSQDVFCIRCLDGVLTAYNSLSSDDGFGTWAI